jgi:hypothetical protein
MPLERPFVYVFKFPFHTNVCMLTLSLTSFIALVCQLVGGGCLQGDLIMNSNRQELFVSLFTVKGRLLIGHL